MPANNIMPANQTTTTKRFSKKQQDIIIIIDRLNKRLNGKPADDIISCPETQSLAYSGEHDLTDFFI